VISIVKALDDCPRLRCGSWAGGFELVGKLNKFRSDCGAHISLGRFNGFDRDRGGSSGGGRSAAEGRPLPTAGLSEIFASNAHGDAERFQEGQRTACRSEGGGVKAHGSGGQIDGDNTMQHFERIGHRGRPKTLQA
jgi:hypothetical protein